MQETTFRVEDFTGYKAQRKPMEEDLSSQIPKVIEVMESFGIKMIGVNGYEADDVIATVAKKFEKEYEVVIVSNDRDLWQLASPTVSIMLPNTKGSVEWLGPKEVLARFGFPPSNIADYKGLRGDPSDNIPGVWNW
jgi:DNA polymerase I